MSKNLELKSHAAEFADGEITQDEYIRRTLDELVYGHSTAFWCRVMEERALNDPGYTRR